MKCLIFVLLLCVPGFSSTYYMSPTGADTNNGTSASTPWLTLNHALNCGDTVNAAASTAYGAQTVNGNVTCSGHGFVHVLCATPMGCAITIASGNLDAMDIVTSHWWIDGWYTQNTSGSTNNGNCFAVFPAGSTNITDVLVTNSYADKCSGSGFAARNNGTAGYDYVAFIGDLSYQAGNTNTYCAAAFSFGSAVAYDTLPGTHLYMGGDFGLATNNPNGCFDGEAFIVDTLDGGNTMPHAYAQQVVIDNSLAIGNTGPNVVVEFNQNNIAVPAGPYATVYVRHVTADVSSFGSNLYGSTFGGEFLLNKTENTHLFGNAARTNGSGIGGDSANQEYASLVMNADQTSIISGNVLWSGTGHYTSLVNSPTFAYGGNSTANPGFPTPYSPPVEPNCSGFATTTACMASVVSTYSATLAGYGYQQPSMTPVSDPLFPQWLCNIGIPPGFVTMGCAGGINLFFSGSAGVFGKAATQ